jgi:hypothetical protein
MLPPPWSQYHTVTTCILIENPRLIVLRSDVSAIDRLRQIQTHSDRSFHSTPTMLGLPSAAAAALIEARTPASEPRQRQHAPWQPTGGTNTGADALTAGTPPTWLRRQARQFDMNLQQQHQQPHPWGWDSGSPLRPPPPPPLPQQQQQQQPRSALIDAPVPGAATSSLHPARGGCADGACSVCDGYNCTCAAYEDQDYDQHASDPEPGGDSELLPSPELSCQPPGMSGCSRYNHLHLVPPCAFPPRGEPQYQLLRKLGQVGCLGACMAGERTVSSLMCGTHATDQTQLM